MLESPLVRRLSICSDVSGSCNRFEEAYAKGDSDKSCFEWANGLSECLSACNCWEYSVGISVKSFCFTLVSNETRLGV